MTAVKILTAIQVGDRITVMGTVDGVESNLNVWASYLNTLANKAAQQTFIAQQMKKQIDAQKEVAVDVLGTVNL